MGNIENQPDSGAGAEAQLLNRQLKRWRLILGKSSEEKLNSLQSGGPSLLNSEENIMDEALAAIYDHTGEPDGSSKRGAGLGPSYPNIAKWLADIRSFFPNDVVSVIQSDAIERKGLKQLLLEPEALAQVKPDVNIVGALLALKEQIPNKSKEQARALVKALVDEIMRQIEHDLRRAVAGALNRKQHSPIPSLPNTDWKKTIRKNLKNYDREKKRIIPEKFYFFENRRVNKEWHIILDMDQSGSMADSIIYASIMGSIFATMPSLDTRIVAFDTEVADLRACLKSLNENGNKRDNYNLHGIVAFTLAVFPQSARLVQ
ncbi:MAG: VWA domain-containing protein, partial [Treponema sp.]|nr:VWA domain-containing protein [Treponema sp.]